MGDQEKNVKENFDARAKTIRETTKRAPGKVVGLFILVLIVINSFWNLWENGNKVSAELQTLKADLAALAARQTELQTSAAETAELENLKTNIEFAKETLEAHIASITKASESFETKLDALIKTEEAKLESLLREAENQRTYIEELKKLVAGESKR
jgi:DNA repair exonuclease SbcCD ATPase subunit